MSRDMDLTPLQIRVRKMIEHEIAKSTAPELEKYLLAITGGLAVRCIDSPHVDQLLDQLGSAINTLGKIASEAPE